MDTFPEGGRKHAEPDIETESRGLREMDRVGYNLQNHSVF